METRAQIISFDFVIGVVAITIAVLVMMGLIILMQKSAEAPAFELEYLFANLEHNLNHAGEPGIAFLHGHRADAARLANFVDQYNSMPGTDFLDNFVIGNTSATHGIGLEPAGYDTCLFFTNGTSNIDMGGGKIAIGDLKPGSDPDLDYCDSAIALGKNPCANYKSAVSLFMPVLLDRGDPATNKIVQLNIVVCKK
jgi:hypothetical protein